MEEVAILLCTFRGEQHLARQLDSIIAQTHPGWSIYVSDDGSDDATLEILAKYRDQLGPGRLRVFAGPRAGFAANFFSLLARQQIVADAYAFTDQDDEWQPHKLERAVNALREVPAQVPALYGSRSIFIRADGTPFGASRSFARPASFANALVQNIVSGNTMVLNHAAIALMRSAGLEPKVSAHDWWAYLLVTGCGGVMIYDREPTIRYRQHAQNLYGENVSLRAATKRISKLLGGDFRVWNSQNLRALRASWPLLTPESRARVELFEAARRGRTLARLHGLVRSRVYRQTWDGQLGLFVAAALNRL